MRNNLLIKILIFTLSFINVHAEVAYTEQTLTANGGDGVAISAEWAFVGDQDGCLVHIYKLDYTTMEWGDGTTPDTIYQTLGNNCNAAGFRRFGASVSNSGNWLVVGAPQGTNNNGTGAFHLYEYNSASGDWEARTGNKGYQGEDIGAIVGGQFGASVSMRGIDDISKLLIVGAPADGANGAGKAYVFTLTLVDSSVNLNGEFSGENTGDNFGLSVTSDGTRFLIGAPQHDTATLTNAGKAYLYSTINSTTADETYVGIQAGAERGKELSLSSTDYMLLSGNIATIFDGTQALPSPLNPIKEVTNTNGGDVSQSVGVVAVAKKDTEVLIYPDVENSSLPEISITKDLLNFGEDINLYKDQLIVNGGNVDGNDEAYVYDFPCGYKPTKLIANEWAMVSVPCGDGTATIDVLFGDDMTVDDYCITELDTEVCTWTMYKDGPTYTGTSADSVHLGATEVMELGKGYWIIADHDVTLQADSNAVTTRTPVDVSKIPASDSVGAYYFAALPDHVAGGTMKKMMMGNAFPRAFNWTELMVYDGTVGSLFSDGTYYDPTGYVYDVSSTTGQPYRAVTATPGFDGDVQPYQAFWIKQVDTGANVTGLEIALPIEK